MAAEEYDLQSIYDEMNRRGLLKQPGDELQQLGHEMRRRGLIKDPTQGGLATPTQLAPPVTPPGAPGPAGPPVLPPTGVGPVPSTSPPGVAPPPSPPVGAAALRPPAAAVPRGVPPATPPATAAVPKLSPIVFRTHDAEQRFWETQRAYAVARKAPVFTAAGVAEKKRLLDQSLAALGGALPELVKEVNTHSAAIQQEEAALTQAEAAIGRGMGNAAQAQAIRRQRQALEAKKQLYNERHKAVMQYQKRWQAWAKTIGDKPLHGGLYYGDEPQASVEQSADRVLPFIAPNAAYADAQRRTNRRNLMLTGKYPTLPPLPGNLSPAQRAEMIRRKNEVVEWVRFENENPGMAQRLGGPATVFRSSNRKWEPWEDQLLPVLREQFRMEVLARDKTHMGRALVADAAMWVAGGAVGRIAGRATAGALAGRIPEAALRAAPTLTPAVPTVAAGSVGGAAGSAAGAFAGTKVAGGTTPEAVKAAARSVPAGAALGAGLGVLAYAYRPAAQILSQKWSERTPKLINEATVAVQRRFGLTDEGAIQYRQKLTELAQDTTLTAAQKKQVLKNLIEGIRPGQQPPAEPVAGPVESYEAGGPRPRGEYKTAVPRQPGAGGQPAQRGEGRFARLETEEGTGAAPPAEPATPGRFQRIEPVEGTAPTEAPVAPTAGGGPLQLQQQTPTRGPVTRVPEAGAAPLRQTPRARLEATAGQNPEVQQHLAQRDAYDRWLAGTPPTVDTAPRYQQEWQTTRNPARLQVEAIRKAAETATEPGVNAVLTRAAEHVENQWNQGFRQRVQDPNLTADEVNNAVAPVEVSPWRQLTPEQQAGLPQSVQTALLVQDVVNSQQVLDPTVATVFTPREVGAKNRAALEETADRLFTQAQQHAANQGTATPAQAQIPAGQAAAEAVPSSSGQIAEPPQAIPTRPGQLQGLMTAPPVKPSELPAKPSELLAKPSELQVGQRVASPRVMNGQPLEIVDTSDPSMVTVRTPSGGTAKIGRAALADAQVVPGDVPVSSQNVPALDVGPSTAPVVTPAAEEMPTLTEAQRQVGRVGAQRRHEQRQAVAQIGRVGGKRAVQKKQADTIRDLARKGFKKPKAEEAAPAGVLTRKDVTDLAYLRNKKTGDTVQVRGGLLAAIVPGKGHYVKWDAQLVDEQGNPIWSTNATREVLENELDQWEIVEKPTRPERRVDVARRKRVAEMSEEEKARALLTDDLTGLGNARAYDESEKRAFQCSSDADSLKWWNETFGHPAGDALLRTIGHAFHHALAAEQPGVVAAYHISGDEFVAQSDDMTALRRVLKATAELVEQATLTLPQKDKTRRTFTGLGLTYAITDRNEEVGQRGDEEYRPAYADADFILGKLKETREAQGLRAARGEQPPRFRELTPEGGPGAEGRGGVQPAEREEGPGAVYPQGQEFELVGPQGAPLELVSPPAATEPLGEYYRFADLAENDLKRGQLVRYRRTGEIYSLQRRRVAASPYWEADLEDWPGKQYGEEAEDTRDAEQGGQEFTEEELLAGFDFARMTVPENERVQEVAAAPVEETRTQQAGPEIVPAVEGMPEGYDRLIQSLYDDLRNGRPMPLNIVSLNQRAREYVGGGIGSGEVTPRDIYDAVEAAVALYMIRGKPLDPVPARAILSLENLLKLLPTQTVRTTEQVEHQQFSTPPTIAFVAALAAMPRKADIVLEPSAGTGSLAAMMVNMGVPQAQVHANEIAPRRAAILAAEGFPVTNADAEAINSSLPQEIQPTLIVMNPPFSATGGRVRKHSNKFGFRHVEDALERLQPGGRLVAIMGEGQSPAHPTADAFWDRVKKKYNVRGVVVIPGEAYQKYGTKFPTLIAVIDKTTATEGPLRLHHSTSLPDAVEFLQSNGILERPEPAARPAATRREERPTGAAQPAGAARAADTRPGRAVVEQSAGAERHGPETRGEGTTAVRAPAVRGAVEQPVSTEVSAGPTGAVSGTQPVSGTAKPPRRRVELRDLTEADLVPGTEIQHRYEGTPRLRLVEYRAHKKRPTEMGWAAVVTDPRRHPTLREGQELFLDPSRILNLFQLVTEKAPAGGKPGVMPKSVLPEGEATPAPVEAAPPPEAQEAKESAGYVPYQQTAKEGRPHPGGIVETAGMSATAIPPITAKHQLKPETIHPTDKNKGISGMQLEFVLQSIQRHEIILPSGQRAGIMNGDGTGAGKGRTNAAIIGHNWSAGRRRAIWVSVSANLSKQASEDFADIGYGEIPISLLTDHPHGQDIGLKEGVIFTTYQGLIGESDKKGAKIRWQQLVDWLGEDGVMIFDEAHRMQNIGSESVNDKGEVVQSGAASARAAVSMQTELPKAYVVYSSATAMTEVEDMEFMGRLGLWGPGTAFPEGFSQFAAKIGTAGIGAMERVAQDMKAMGVYQARFLDFSEVEYVEDIYTLDADQRATYDAAVRAWVTIGNSLQEAFAITQASSGKKLAILRAYYGEVQDFFRSLITTLKTKGVIGRTEKEIAAGRSVIISLLLTGESTQSKNSSKMLAEGMSLDEMDFTVKQRMISFIQRTFPLQNYREEEYTTESGQTRTRMVPVNNPDGTPQINPRALAVQNKLLDDVQDVQLPENPIDIILNHFGHKNVAELTGRKKRREVRNGKLELVNRKPEKGAQDKVNLDEMAAFQEGRKRIAITSKASSTGFSLHSDLSRKNQQQRVHILMELPWSADEAMQIFGRSHRTNQASAPIYVLASTDIGGERRFSSTIAKRLESLGALTRGSRSASGSGSALAKYNYESRYGRAAVDALYNHLLNGQVPPGFPARPGWTPIDALQRMGVYRQQQGGGMGVAESAEGNVKTLLNRIMFLELESQNPLFNAFHNFFERIVAHAKAEGTFDDGMEDIKALAIRRTGAPQLLHKDRVTGTETKVFPLEIDTPHERVEFTDWILNRGTSAGPNAGFIQNTRTGKVAYRRDFSNRRHADRSEEAGWTITTPGSLSGGVVFESAFAGEKPTWKVIERDEAQKLWEAELAEVPAVHTQKTNMIVGTLLPIWNEVEHALGDGVKVKRVTADDGTRYMGVTITGARLQNLQGALGVATGPISPEVVHLQAWEDRATVLLARGARLLRTRVAGEDVIQVMGLDSATIRYLAEQGFPNTRMGLETRIWIPEGRMDLLEKLLDLFPAVGNPTRQQSPQEQQQAGRKGGEVTNEEPRQTPPADEVEAFYRRNNGAPRQKDAETLYRKTLRMIEEGRRRWKHLPRTPEFAELRLFLIRLEQGRELASQEAMIEMADIVRGLSRPEYDLFNLVLVTRDMAEQAQRWASLVAEGRAEGEWQGPEGLTEIKVLEAIDNQNAQLAENPKVREALARRAEVMDRIKTEYQRAVTAVLGRPPKMDREDYFRHQVLEYLAQDRPAPQGTGSALKAPTFRGFIKARGYSEKAYNTAWVEAEHEVLSQMIYDTQLYRLLRYVQDKWDIKPKLMAQAAQMNEDTLQDVLQEMADAQNEELGAEPDVPLVTAEDVRKEVFTERWKFAAGMDLLRKLARNDELPDMPQGAWAAVILALKGDQPLTGDQMKQVMKYAAWLMRQADAGRAGMGAAMLFKATAAKQKTTRALLGKRRVTWEDLIPEGYMTYQPQEGNVFYRAWSVPDRLAEQAMTQGASAIGLEPGDIQRVFAMGGKRRELVLPDPVALTIGNFTKPYLDSLEQDYRRGAARFLGYWKGYQLLNPQRFIGYNLRNEVGDLEASLFNPEGMGYMLRALDELVGFMSKHRHPRESPSPQLRAWLRRGGMQATLQAAERIGSGAGLDLLAKFAAANATKPTIPQKVWNGIWGRLRGSTDLREAVARYAHFLAYRAQIERSDTGLPANFGASNRNDVLAIRDYDDRAYKLSNELIGAYDDVGELGRLIAQNWIPFWRWQEVNWTRTMGLAMNDIARFSGGGGSGGGGGRGGGAGPGGDWDEDDVPPWQKPWLAAKVGARVATMAGLRASRLGVGVLIGLGVFTIKAHLLAWGLYAYNRQKWGDLLDQIPEYDRGRPILILGRNEATGEVMYYTRLGAFQDVASWFGYDNAYGYAQAWANGRMSIAEIAREMALQPVDKVMGSLGPAATFWEAWTGRKLFPDPFNPREIRDRGEYLFDSFSLGDLYRRWRGIPERRGTWQRYVGAKVAQVGEANYQEMYGLARRFLEKKGKSTGGGDRNPRGNALYGYKRALKVEDKDAALHYLVQFAKAKGTDAGYAASMKTMDPLFGMNDADEEEFLASLSPADQRRLLTAYRHWGGLFDVKLPDEKAIEGKKFLRQIHTLRGRIERAIDKEQPLRKMKKTMPELKPIIREAERAAR